MSDNEEVKMIRISWKLEIGFLSSARTGEIEVEDYASDYEIDDLVKEQAMQHVSWSWERVP